ncbi:hypothetical protein J7J18_03840 [bacterium]|nr:hypothetical protein [bacterium]
MSVVIDETGELTVIVLGNPLAVIDDIKIACKQPDDTWKVFSVLQGGETPQAVAGVGTLKFDSISSGIWVRNNGDAQGILFCRVKDQLGNIIFERQSPYEIDVGVGYIFPQYDPQSPETVLFDMPTHDYVIIVEAGHIE